MIARSAPALVATCTAVLGLHSSSSTTSSYSYFAPASALRSLTASSAELRPPMPFAATPPVNGPMNATLTLSLASAGAAKAATSRTAAATATAVIFPIIHSSSSRHAAIDVQKPTSLQNPDRTHPPPPHPPPPPRRPPPPPPRPPWPARPPRGGGGGGGRRGRAANNGLT